MYRLLIYKKGRPAYAEKSVLQHEQHNSNNKQTIKIQPKYPEI
jgi:hypothetical protein